MSVLFLSACGGDGYDVSSIRDPGSKYPNPGDGIIGKPPIPNTPPEIQSHWEYSSTEIEGSVLSLRATNYSLNTFKRPDYNDLEGKVLLKLERVRSQNDTIADTVIFSVDSKTSCLPSCEVRMSFDGNSATYRMQQNSDGDIKPIHNADEAKLFESLSSSQKATVSIPITGLSTNFEARFDLHDYDKSRMILD